MEKPRCITCVINRANGLRALETLPRISVEPVISAEWYSARATDDDIAGEAGAEMKTGPGLSRSYDRQTTFCLRRPAIALPAAFGCYRAVTSATGFAA
ncbi:unnamed protein product [Clonostachys rosea]|uniref:Uncharacterized protein n=1 Tax=Bionectria ochroleuca TaxID=29856 RepID=A0ABY6TWT3_BIOOC|nr:unnamed protein product [Clonostachys rosea]